MICALGLHVFEKWHNNNVISVYAEGTDKTNSYPIRQYIVQQRTCMKCGITKFRNEVIR